MDGLPLGQRAIVLILHRSCLGTMPAHHAFHRELSDLASITSSEENEFVHSLQPTDFPSLDMTTPHTLLWIGMHDPTTEGTWEWIDGTSASYINWGAGDVDTVDENEPNNALGAEHVATLRTADGTWNSQGYVCKSGSPRRTCMDGWSSFRAACYRTLFSSKLSWDDAHSSCISHGADLASITWSGERNDFVKSLIL